MSTANILFLAVVLATFTGLALVLAWASWWSRDRSPQAVSSPQRARPGSRRWGVLDDRKQRS